MKSYLKASVKNNESNLEEVFCIDKEYIRDYQYDETAEQLRLKLNGVVASLKKQALFKIKTVSKSGVDPSSTYMSNSAAYYETESNQDLIYFELESDYIEKFINTSQDSANEKKLYFITAYSEPISPSKSNPIEVEITCFNPKSQTEKFLESANTIIQFALLLLPGLGELKFLEAATKAQKLRVLAKSMGMMLNTINTASKINNIYCDKDYANNDLNEIIDFAKSAGYFIGDFIDESLADGSDDYNSNDYRELLASSVFEYYELAVECKNTVNALVDAKRLTKINIKRLKKGEEILGNSKEYALTMTKAFNLSKKMYGKIPLFYEKFNSFDAGYSLKEIENGTLDNTEKKGSEIDEFRYEIELTLSHTPYQCYSSYLQTDDSDLQKLTVNLDSSQVKSLTIDALSDSKKNELVEKNPYIVLQGLLPICCEKYENKKFYDLIDFANKNIRSENDGSVRELKEISIKIDRYNRHLNEALERITCNDIKIMSYQERFTLLGSDNKGEAKSDTFKLIMRPSSSSLKQIKFDNQLEN